MLRWNTEEQVPERHFFRILKESNLMLNQHQLHVKWHWAGLSDEAPQLSPNAASELTSSANTLGEWAGMGPIKSPHKKCCTNRLRFVTGNDTGMSMRKWVQRKGVGLP